MLNHVLPRHWSREGHTKFKRWSLAVFGPENNTEKQDRGTALQTSRQYTARKRIREIRKGTARQIFPNNLAQQRSSCRLKVSRLVG
jgi:hypothetical protein